MSREVDTVVIGLGNVVLSDDGLGVHAVRRLRDRYRLEDRVELVEGGQPDCCCSRISLTPDE